MIFFMLFSGMCLGAGVQNQDHKLSSNNFKLQGLNLLKIKNIDLLFKKYVKWGRFNGNVVVISQGVPIYNRSFGMADFKKQKKLTGDSIFQLASISKQFTAMAIMLLKEDGLLNYEDKITKYIPVFPYKTVTVRNLLNHTGGMPNYMWVVEHLWKKTTKPYNDDVIKLLVENKTKLYFTPGTRFNYSNTGYIVLAHIVEKITRQKFHQYVKKNIFEPLKMNDSFVFSSVVNGLKQSKMVKSYKRRWKKFRYIPGTIHDGIVGDKGVYSTVNDLLKWNLALNNNSLVSSSTLKKAFTRLVLKNKYKWHYGFGFRIKGYDENKLVYHFGKWNNYHTYFGRFLKNNSTVIVLSNTGDNITYIVKNIEKILNSNKQNLSIPIP